MKRVKKYSRKLSRKSRNSLNVMFAIILGYFIFTSLFSKFLGISPIIFWVVIATLFLTRSKNDRKLSLSKGDLFRLRTYGENNHQKIYRQEKRQLFQFLVNNPIKFKKLTPSRLKDFVNEYMLQVYGKDDNRQRNLVSKLVDKLYDNESKVKKLFSRSDRPWPRQSTDATLYPAATRCAAT